MSEAKKNDVNSAVSLDEARLSLSARFSAEKIQSMGAIELLELQKTFRLGDVWGTLIMPTEWMPPSRVHTFPTNLMSSFRTIARSETELELAIITSVRMFLLCLFSPSQVGRHSPRLLDITTISVNLRSIWISILKRALAKPSNSSNGLIERLTWDELSLRGEIREMRRFENFAAKGLWTDKIRGTPSFRKPSLLQESMNLQRGKKPGPYKPLPDAFVYEIGKRSAWIATHLAPFVVSVFEKIASAPLTTRKGKRLHRSTELKRQRALVCQHKWESPDGGTLQCLPFEIKCVTKTGGREMQWPPTSIAQLFTYLAICQMAHYFIVALSCGPRASEIFSFKTNCLSSRNDGIGVAFGTTYKVVDPLSGVNRDWPLPEIGIAALENQIRISKLLSAYLCVIRGKEKEHQAEEFPLWRVIGGNTPGAPLMNVYNGEIRWYVDALDLTHLLDEQLFTNHRFRKTIARVLALALVNAPKILMDVFGHDSMESTMSYILSDKNVRAQVQEIRRELVILMAKQAISNADGNGGRAAAPLRETIKKIRFRNGGDFGADDENELAEMLTGQGRFWQWVRPGVMCTKVPEQRGPCTKNQSQPNPSRCSADCRFRLEDAENRQQVDETIADIVNKIESAVSRDDRILAELWEGQLLSHIKRFDDLLKKWQEHPTVASVLVRRSEVKEHTNAVE